MINEEAIRKEVNARQYQLNVAVSRRTPTGRLRGVPLYYATVKNDFLSEAKMIKGHSPADVGEKARRQIEKWNDLEIRQRVGGVAQEAKEVIESIRSILDAGLQRSARFDWDELLDRSEFHKFVFDRPEPFKPEEPRPLFPFLEILIPILKRRREARWMTMRTAWENEHAEWFKLKNAAESDYAKEKNAFDVVRVAKNAATKTLQLNLEKGDPTAIIECSRMALERSTYPECFAHEVETSFEASSGTLVVDLSLPAPDAIPDVVEVKYDARNAVFKKKTMKKSEHEELYDSALKQCVLRSMHEVFEACYPPAVSATVVNGWVTSLDKATGNSVTSCLISVAAERSKFQTLNLAKIDPTECIKGLKGLVAGPMAHLSPVKPIMQLNKEDHRFIESKEVLAGYNSETNLAEIPWEEFEQLVRELFAEMFSKDGGEVKVTQASRDGGVDAVAFDPDPIRGGKFVIQAKRYTNVVDVSAVRDLYGTMINEGAAKGILVTTSHFGRDSRAFAQDKPITLIDGSNLVFLLEKFGHKVRIDIESARKHRLEPKDGASSLD